MPEITCPHAGCTSSVYINDPSSVQRPRYLLKVATAVSGSLPQYLLCYGCFVDKAVDWQVKLPKPACEKSLLVTFGQMS